MKKILLAGVAITLLLAGVAASADWRQGHYIPYDISKDPVAKLAWNAANIDKLRAFDKAAIIRFAFAGIDRSDELLDFGWFDLAGDGRYQLAVISSIGRGPNWLDINWQDAPGKMRKDGGDSFAGAAAKLSETFRDLNGDGKLEIVLSTALGVNAAWPQILRVQNGGWVDASREFPRFYDTEVLPQLEKDIGEARENVAKHQGDPKPSPGPLFDLAERGWREPQRLLASLLMRRDKILRVLGRDPNAGLAGAREWVKSDDPELVQDAVDVFEDIGGHQQELGAAKSTLERVEQPASPADLL